MLSILFAVLLLAIAAAAQTVNITSPTTPPGVAIGATQTFTADQSGTWSVACTGTGCCAGSINSGTGVYTNTCATLPQNESRGCQILPNNSIYNAPINTLGTDPRSGYWLQRVIDNRPDLQKPYHNFKLGSSSVVGNFYDVPIDNSTPLQFIHSSSAGNTGPYQDTMQPLVQPPAVTQQSGWSVDVQGCQSGCAAPDRHLFEVNRQTCTLVEYYNPRPDFENITWALGNPTVMNFTTKTLRPIPNLLRVFGAGALAPCTSFNYNASVGNSTTFLATVISSSGIGSGSLSIPFNSTACTGSAFANATLSATGALVPSSNAAAVLPWPQPSNNVYGGTDAAGSSISATSIHVEEWLRNVQLGILDPACNCVVAGRHVLRTTLSNQYISPRNLWPAILGTGVTGGHPNMALLSVVTGSTTTFALSPTGCGGTPCLTNQTPCAGFTYTPGCTFHITIGSPVGGSYTGTWAAANGDWLATGVDSTHFTIPLNSTGFPALPANGTFIFDWMPYGTRLRLKASFDSDTWAAANCTTTVIPYCKALLNELKVYGLMVLDGTGPQDNWDTGIINSEGQPDDISNALISIRNLCQNTTSGCTLSGTSFEQLLEVVDESSLQVSSVPYTTTNNQLLTTPTGRVTVTITAPGHGTASLDVSPIGTTIGTDHERITIATGTTYQINAWVNGNTSTGLSYAMSPAVTGASVSSTGLITAPTTLAALTPTVVTVTSAADAHAVTYVQVFFVPTSPDNSIRLNFGQHATSYTDTHGNVWWGQVVPRGFNTSYQIGDGVLFATLNGTWTSHSAQWNTTTVDPQLYAQSTSEQNDTQLVVAVPNGSYTLTFYGEPGYNICSAGANVFDIEVQGTVVSSYNDGFLLSGGSGTTCIYQGYTLTYPATVTNGVLQVGGRIREADAGGHGMSLSSLLITPGSLPLSITTASVPNASDNQIYNTTLSATGGVTPYTWSIIAGSLPGGLSLTTVTNQGVISGTPNPAVTGNFPFTVQVADSAAHTAPRSYLINVIGITTLTPPAGVVGVPYNYLLAAAGGSPPYGWSLASGALCTGLSLSSGGAISGTPSIPGTCSFNVRALDSGGPPRFTVSPLSITITGTPPPAQTGLTGDATLVGGSIK